MRLVIFLPLGFLALACTQNQAGSEGGEHSKMQHAIIRPDQLQWKDVPALPAGAKAAVLEGDPMKEGYFAMRIMMPDGYQIPPHFHPGVERLTIIPGKFHLGQGEKFDRAATETLGAGTYGFMPPGMRHFAWAEGPTVVQITTLGPWGITYVNSADDPRKQK